MSAFSDLLTRGFEHLTGQMTDAAGDPVEIERDGTSVPCVPGSSARSKELRDAGVWEQGMLIVELARADFARLGLTLANADRKEVLYGPATARRRMKVFIVDDDPADPCLRLTLQPDRNARA